MVENKKQEKAVVHFEIDGKYYRNLKALCDSWDKDALGVLTDTFEIMD